VTSARLIIVSTCKPFVGEDARRQQNAIISWIEAVGASNVLLVGNEPGVAEICDRFGVANDPVVERVDGRLPTLSGVLNSPSLNMAEFVCYVNADVMMPMNTLDVVIRVARDFSHFMIVGERWDIDLDREVNPEEIRSRAIETTAQQTGRLPGPHWIDYFIYPHGLLGTIPGMAISGGLWDHWIVGRALQNGAAVVDATRSLTAVHQNHPRPDSLSTEERRQYNLRAIGDSTTLATITNATHQLTSGGALRQTPASKRLFARVLHLLGPLARASRPIRQRIGVNLDFVYRILRR
jgi:hypothetical protein